MSTTQPADRDAARAIGLNPQERRNGSSEVVERALDVLLSFLDTEGELGVSEIARRLDMDKGRVHRFLTAFKRKGLIAANARTHRYSLGFRVLELSVALSRQFDVVAQAQPFLHELQGATSETAGLAALVGDHRVHLAQVESEHDIRQSFPIGKPLPIYAGAVGKVLLAFLPAEEMERLLAKPLEPLGPATIVDRDQLQRELIQVRQQGYAVSLGERVADSRSIAAPVWSWRGDVMAVNLSGPASRFTAEKALAASGLIRDAASRLTRQLGGEPFARAVSEWQVASSK